MSAGLRFGPLDQFSADELKTDSSLSDLLIPPCFSSSYRNIIHGSDSVESAKKEISLWFKDDELVLYTPCAHAWLY